jgi:hypothetical protein
MKSVILQSLTILALWGLIHAWPLALAAMPGPGAAQGDAPNPGPDPLALDRTFVQAMSGGGRAALELIADPDFIWINSQGVSISRPDAFGSMASGKGPTLLIGANDAQPTETTYGSQMAVIQRHKDKMHSMHVWVRRAAGWKLLNIVEVTEIAQVPYGGTTINATCVNPCTKVPFMPGNVVQQAVMASWQDQQSGPEGWLRRVATTNVSYSSVGVRSHASRVAVMNQQKASGTSVASPPLLWARIWDFDGSALMLSIQQGNNSKAFWASRVFTNQGGNWTMVESFQTYVQDASVMVNAPAK